MPTVRTLYTAMMVILAKASGYASLILTKKLADALGGVERARAVLDVLAKLP